jgi:hypothetical protein
VSRLAKGWRVGGVMVRAAMVKKKGRKEWFVLN